MWRWRELLPVRRAGQIVSLGEAATPLVDLPACGRRFGLASLLVKDEGRLPTGSFKARGLAVAVSMAKALGHRQGRDADQRQCRRRARRLCAPAPASRRSCSAPRTRPTVNVREIAAQGARVYRVNGLIDECGAIVAEGARGAPGSTCRR